MAATSRKSRQAELDSDKVNLIEIFLPKLPEYFSKTDKLYEIIVTGNGIDHPSAISIMMETKKKVDQLFDLGNAVFRAVLGVIVSLAIGGLLFLIRYAPVLQELEKLTHTP